VQRIIRNDNNNSNNTSVEKLFAMKGTVQEIYISEAGKKNLKSNGWEN
jgi:hypothetical protein